MKAESTRGGREPRKEPTFEVPLHVERNVEGSSTKRLTKRKHAPHPLFSLKDDDVIDSRMQRDNTRTCGLHEPGDVTRGIVILQSVYDSEPANDIP
jgi:hypothetical protein